MAPQLTIIDSPVNNSLSVKEDGGGAASSITRARRSRSNGKSTNYEGSKASDVPTTLNKPSMCSETLEGGPPLLAATGGSDVSSTRQQWGALAILFFVNLINYMDRVTIASVLSDVEKVYSLTDKEAGFLQTAFVVSYMVFAPLFGYLGDRYSRKLLMAAGILMWSLTTLLGSWPPKDFWVFLLLRAFVGVGEASYSTIAPTLIGDIFYERKRTLALGVFYYAIPIGSGLGYMLGSHLAQLFGRWYWALRITPMLGIVATFLVLFTLREPPRGEADGGPQMATTPIRHDIRDLLTNLSFVWATLGFTAATFTLGAMSWWAPTFVTRAYALREKEPDEQRINVIFGAITCVGGAVGITLAVYLSSVLRNCSKRADPAICAAGLIGGAPLLLFAILSVSATSIFAWVLFFFGLTLVSFNWSIVPDMLLYTVSPTRRGTASAIQILASHMFGDAASPYIVGMISDLGCQDCSDSDKQRLYTSLKNAMLLPVGVLLVGGVLFTLNIFTIIRDRNRCQLQMQGYTSPGSSVPGDDDAGEDSLNGNSTDSLSSHDRAGAVQVDSVHVPHYGGIVSVT